MPWKEAEQEHAIVLNRFACNAGGKKEHLHVSNKRKKQHKINHDIIC